LVPVPNPFHLVRLANDKLDECRRRVQNETLGHRGRKHDPLYRVRKLLVMASERVDNNGRTKMLGLLTAGNPRGEVKTAWHAKEEVRNIYRIVDPATAAGFVAQLGHDLQDDSCPPEINQLGRTLIHWHAQISAWHQARVSNGPTEAVNNLINASNEPASDSDVSPHTGSEHCSTPASPTGISSPPSHPLKSEVPHCP
jgi:transposase